MCMKNVDYQHMWFNLMLSKSAIDDGVKINIKVSIFKCSRFQVRGLVSFSF